MHRRQAYSELSFGLWNTQCLIYFHWNILLCHQDGLKGYTIIVGWKIWDHSNVKYKSHHFLQCRCSETVTLRLVITWLLLPAQFLHSGFLLTFHIKIKSILLWVHPPPFWYETIVSIEQVKEIRKTGKKITQNRILLFPVDIMWPHWAVSSKNFTPHVKYKVIFPPCLWNPENKDKLWQQPPPLGTHILHVAM